MKVLLDENFPPRVQPNLIGHRCAHVIKIGWRGILNGSLLTKAEQAGFVVLITLDTNIPDQSTVAGRNISVYVLLPDGPGTEATRAPIGEVLIALQNDESGQVLTFTNRNPQHI
jgi:predicted nuclease of predicted toxin-antitoxin system